ncbi:integrase/recombinase xerD homolog [Dysidea avara]|uniref:integrase/recombinase xerD homolog n=1 Tax=Dysidea avara TaxID=196820 RepID=UPI00331EB4F4
MVSTRAVPPHQLPGAASSHLGSTDLCKREIRHFHPPTNRQLNSSRLYQQEGGNSITQAVPANKGPVVVVHGEEYPPSRPAPTRNFEHDCGRGIQNLVRQVRVETLSNPIPGNQSSFGTSVHRFVCKQTVISASSICELETRSTSSGHRCLYSGLEQPSREAVCQSPLGFDRQSPISSSYPRSSGASTGCTSMEGPTMVSHAPANAGQSTNPYPTVSRHNTASVSEQSTGHHPTISCVGYIRQQCEGSHLSQTATDLVLSSWRDRSTKSYNSSFGKWASWCAERNRNPFSGPISDVANFLAELFEQGYQHSSLNSYRSAISSTHEKVDGMPVGQHPTIVRVLKGAYNQRPPLPRYSFTWEVTKVTSYITALGDNESLSLKMLSFKLVVLLALTRPSRSNDLSNLSLKAMRVLPDGVQFNPACLSKQSKPSRPLKPFIFPSFSSDKRLCPKEALAAYITRTESFRGEGKDKLLLSYVKPHNPISSSSVARWIVSMLKLAGIDTDTFKSHSTRSASASAAASAGITTNQIMEAADWRSESVFERFYYKPTSSNQMGQAVLSTSSSDSLQTSR